MKNHLLSLTQKHFPFLRFLSLKIFGSWSKTFISFLLLSSIALLHAQTVYNSGSGTFAVPANVTHVNAAAWGGGGGGGGSTTNNRGGNGGGGGGAASYNLINVLSGNTFSYSVGSGGLAGASNGGKGGDGTISTIVSVAPITPAVSLTGGRGTGGLGNRAAISSGNSEGGIATGSAGAILVNGDPGGRKNSGGDGGNSGAAFGIFGVGGSGNSNATGSPGLIPGAGGGGGEKPFFGSDQSGGAGASGRVMFDFISVSAVAPTPVCVGATITITGTNFSTTGTTTVTVNGTACTSVTVVNATTITAVITNGTTSGIVNITNDGRRNNGKSITVNAQPANPGNPTSNSPQCTPPGVTLTRTGTPPTGETWYWQTVANGTSTTNSGATYNVTTSGTYYIRARNNSTQCWSTGAGSASVVVSSPLTAIATTPIPAHNVTGVCYQGNNSVSGLNWSAVANATSYDVYFGAVSLPGTLTANVATNSYNTGALAANTTYFWKIVPRNACGITTGAPVTWKFTTGSAICTASYCIPITSTPANSHIIEVSFLGTLNDVTNTSAYTNGYQNFTGLANKTKQAAGEGMNVFVKSNEVDVAYRAWVDWNKDGNFTNSGVELVYTSGDTRAISTTFGIVIPAGTAPGDYIIRIRNYRYACSDPSGYCSGSYDACENFSGSNYGEAEDYVITVVANCAGNLATVTNAIFCGQGALTLSGKGTTGTTTLRWYDAASGGNLLAETPVDGSLNASFTTPNISSTTTYYVSAFNGTCESIFRRPVVARIRPVPNISFDLPAINANFCGDDNTLKLTSTGEQEQIILIEENFDSGLGVFDVAKGAGDNSTASETQWQNQPSTFTPAGSIWKPAISSGFGANKFAFATSDISTRTVHTIMTSTGSYDTTGFSTLKLDFSAYYSYYGDTSSAAGGTVESFFVEVSTDGTNWTAVKTYAASIGIGTKFSPETIDLNSYKGFATLKLRFRYIAYWGDGLAIDNIKLYGDKPLTTSFVWTAPNIGIFNADCNTNYIDGTPTNSVCLKPTPAQLQTISSWNISALATLSNGCTTAGVITIQNNNKVWDTTASTNWSNTNWQPTTAVPDISKCVLIKKPVNLLNGDGFAKNIKILPGGSLNIKKDRTLTVTDYIKNETTPLLSNEANFVLETDANLIQLNDVVANSGRMTAQRNVIGLRNKPGSAVDYVYWSSPVAGQKTKGAGGFSPGTPTSRFFQYRESNDRFYETADLTFTLGKGYAVMAENNRGSDPFDRLFEFKGTPNNGDISLALLKSPDDANGTVHGYNLVGNPYPSNIDFDQLKYGNDSLIWGSAWFWTNNVYTANQMGSEYTGNNYAIYNGSGGNSATSPYDGGKNPIGIVKVGQSFIVQAKSAGTLTFKNKYDDAHILRVNTPGEFYSKSSVPKNRFWINLVSPSQLSNSQLIAYVPGATDGFEQDFDAEAFGDFSDSFYSILPGKKLLIQGKSEVFTDEDKVTLGANFFQAGSYTIALNAAEGIFDGSQNIYLKDKQEGIITNLSQGSYTFNAIKGDNASRFEIIYKPEAVLVTEISFKDQILIYRDKTDFVIKSPKLITVVELYDTSGKLVFTLKANNTTAILDATSLPNGSYILKIKNKNGEVISRKIVR